MPIPPPREITVKKGHLLQRPGEIEGSVYYVKSGLIRSYIIDPKGKEHIYIFGSAGWYVADHSVSDKPTALFIDAIEDSELSLWPRKDIEQNAKNDLEQLQLQLPSLFRRLDVLQERILMLLSATAIERYQHFVDTYPDIIQRAPQRMIASYLGITPEALSKVKGQALRKTIS